MSYDTLRVLHIFFVISWFAGLFYLPRIFVNHAMMAIVRPFSTSSL